MESSVQSYSKYDLGNMQADLLGLLITNVGEIRVAEAEF